MKKNLLYTSATVLLAILSLASCKNNEPVDLNDAKAVAEAIEGEWQADTTSLNAIGAKGEYKMEFEAVNTFEQNIDIKAEQNIGQVGEDPNAVIKIETDLNGKGTYEIKDSTIHISQNEVKAQIKNLEFPEIVKKQITASGFNEQALKGMMEQRIADSMKKVKFTIIELNAEKMVLRDASDKSITFIKQ